jgi:hypothetical protein
MLESSVLVVSSAFNLLIDYDHVYDRVQATDTFRGAPQLWVIKASQEAPYSVIENQSCSKCLTVSGRELILSTTNYQDEAQQWNVSDVGQGCFSIVNRKTGLALACNSTGIFCTKETKDDNQLWVTLSPTKDEKKSSNACNLC